MRAGKLFELFGCCCCPPLTGLSHASAAALPKAVMCMLCHFTPANLVSYTHSPNFFSRRWWACQLVRYVGFHAVFESFLGPSSVPFAKADHHKGTNCLGILEFSIRKMCPVHQSWAFKMMAVMLGVSALSMVSRFVIFFCHCMPRMERTRLCKWKRSSILMCLLYKVQVSQPDRRRECGRLAHLQLG